MGLAFYLSRFAKLGTLALGLLLGGVGAPGFAASDNLFYPTRSDWSNSNGKVNLSVFVFNDLNENGVFDLGDRAMSGIVTGISRSGAPLAIARSNGIGFANFATSTTDQSAVIDSPGQYEFEVFPPPGWQVSTGNPRQNREIIPIEGSNAGLGMAEMLVPVGLTRYKFIRGIFDMDEPGELVMAQDGHIIARVEMAPGERFRWPVERGEYTLTSGNTVRTVLVGDIPVDIGKISPTPLAPANGQVVDFENMATAGLAKVPNGYAGLNWFNLNFLESNYTQNSVGYVNGTTSGNYVLYTSSGHPARIFADTAFDFIEVNLTLAWPEAESEELVFNFYRGDELVLSDRIGLSAYGPVAYQPRIKGITRVELATVHYWQAVLDDLVINIGE